MEEANYSKEKIQVLQLPSSNEKASCGKICNICQPKTSKDKESHQRCEDFSTLQKDVDRLMNASLTAPCKRVPAPCTDSEQTLQCVFMNGQPCVLLVSVIRKTNLSHKLHPTALPHLVTILGGKYERASVTYHLGTNNHLAFHKLGADKGWQFYDGLEELLNPGKGDVVITDTLMKNKLKAKCKVSHIVMVRDKAAEAIEARRQENEQLVTFIVDHNGDDGKLRAILSSEEESHFSFKDRWVPIIFDDDVQLDKIVKYLSDFLDSCDTFSIEVCTMVFSDRIKYILNVMLSEVWVTQERLIALHDTGPSCYSWRYEASSASKHGRYVVFVLLDKICMDGNYVPEDR
ncbi:hypothetical protein ABVT39_025754 [Epinephelus coioides]